MRYPLLVPVLLVALAIGCGRQAEPAASPHTPAPSTDAEAIAAVSTTCEADFPAFDKNGDGTLSLDEYIDGEYSRIRWVQAPTEADIEQTRAMLKDEADDADKNDDNTVSRDEYMAVCAGNEPAPDESESPEVTN